RGPGVGLFHDRLIDARDAEVDREVGLLIELLEHVDVSNDERTLRDDARRHGVVDERFETSPRQLVLALDRLIRIRGCAYREGTFAVPMQFPAQDVGDVHANFDVAVEVGTYIFLAITRVIGTREAIAALVGTTQK